MASPAYTTDQLEAYLERIGLSSPPGNSSRVAEVKSRSEADPLATLADLQRRHLCAIPWGNSGLHYTQHHTISIHPQTVFDKLVQRRLDGYCMENTNLFFVVLRCLGYQVYATGGRVSHATATGVNNGLFLALYVQVATAGWRIVLMRWQWTYDSDCYHCEREIYGASRCPARHPDSLMYARLTSALAAAALPAHFRSKRMRWRLTLLPPRCAWSKKVC